MFHSFLPLVPLTVAGAVLLKKKNWALLVPVVLVLLKAASTSFYPFYLFTFLGLIAGVLAIQSIREKKGSSLLAVAGYAFIAVTLYELVSSMGLWILGGCTADEGRLYAFTFSGLAEVLRSSFPYMMSHFLRDLPLSVIVVKSLEWILRLQPIKALQPSVAQGK